MLFLHSNKRFNDFAKYDHKTGDYTEYSRDEYDVPNSTEFFGNYEILSNTFVAFYHIEQIFYLRIGNLYSPLSNKIKVKLNGEIDNRQLSLEKEGKTIGLINYAVDKTRIIPNDPTPGVELEHFDFGLFIINIMNDEKRQKVMLGLE